MFTNANLLLEVVASGILCSGVRGVAQILLYPAELLGEGCLPSPGKQEGSCCPVVANLNTLQTVPAH